MFDADEKALHAGRELRDQDEERFCALVPQRHRSVKKGVAAKAILHEVGTPEPPPPSSL